MGGGVFAGGGAAVISGGLVSVSTFGSAVNPCQRAAITPMNNKNRTSATVHGRTATPLILDGLPAGSSLIMQNVTETG